MDEAEENVRSRSISPLGAPIETSSNVNAYAAIQRLKGNEDLSMPKSTSNMVYEE